MGISNITLVKIAAIGGIATVSMGIGLRVKINNNVKDAEFCKEALKTLRTHNAAVQLLGQPIKDRLIDVTDQNKNYIKENSGKYEIPLRGPKQKGVLYMWINRLDENNNWRIERLELGVDSEPDRRLILKS